jgi:DNA polymerase
MPSTHPTAVPFLPDDHSLGSLRKAVQSCRGCPLYAGATQAVFGSGPERATIVLVGEQPGDAEHRAGEPFVGPAGGVLDEALEQAGIPRGETYVTNAVKHFKWRARGQRRIHDKPSVSEQVACRPWLELELGAVRPRAVVLLGATAAQSLLGRDFRVTRSRGRLLDSDVAEIVVATVHPSAVLRADDRESAFEGLLDDLRVAVTALASLQAVGE